MFGTCLFKIGQPGQSVCIDPALAENSFVMFH